MRKHITNSAMNEATISKMLTMSLLSKNNWKAAKAIKIEEKIQNHEKYSN